MDDVLNAAPTVSALLIEDCPDDVLLCLRHLRRGSFKVSADVVETREDFLARIRSKAYDVILADYQLPNWSGIEALELLRAEGQDIPVILVTGTLGEEVAVECMKQGISDYVLKDHLARLPQSVRQVINERILREEQRRAQSQLRLQAAALESAANGILITDGAGNIIWANPAFTKLTGYALEEARGKNPRFLKSGVQDATFYHELWRTIRAGNVWHGQLTNRRKDGTYYDEEMTITPVRDPHGVIAHFVAIKQDVTQRNRGERALRDSERLMRDIINFLPDATFVLDRERKVLAWNHAMEELTCVSAEQMLGKSNYEYARPIYGARRPLLADFVFDSPEEALSTYPASRHENGTLVAETFSPYLGKGGLHLWVAARALRDDEGNIVGAIQSMRDITERKRAEEALARHARDLARSNRDLEQFAYVASHDLLEPLRMVRCFTELLSQHHREKLDPEAAEFMAFIIDGATRMQQLIDGLLSYSRVGTRGQPFKPTSSEAALEGALTNLSLGIQESGAVVTHDPLPVVHADEVQLVQLFQNLLSNAIKFRSSEPPRIHISAKNAGNEWIFAVQDNGIGIESQYFERIFVIYSRLHTREEYPGTGLGLAICKRIVERHAGRIWVESQPGQGSTFYFTLPAGDLSNEACTTHECQTTRRAD